MFSSPSGRRGNTVLTYLPPCYSCRQRRSTRRECILHRCKSTTRSKLQATPDILQSVAPLASAKSRLIERLLSPQVNRNKKSVGLSFQQPEGVKILHELAKTSDVLVENYIPGALKKYQLDYESLRKINPR